MSQRDTRVLPMRSSPRPSSEVRADETDDDEPVGFPKRAMRGPRLTGQNSAAPRLDEKAFFFPSDDDVVTRGEVIKRDTFSSVLPRSAILPLPPSSYISARCSGTPSPPRTRRPSARR